MPAKKILLVQLFSNGDCLYATTVARQIKQDYPGCHLTWIIASFCKDIIANNPYVDSVIVTDAVPKSNVVAFRKFKKILAERKRAGEFDEVFVTQNMDANQAYYDGSIRSTLFRAYPHEITVPVTPVLRLTGKETEKAGAFAEEHQLHRYARVVLFEFAPQSGQLNITREMVLAVSEGIVSRNDAAVILSSGSAISHPDPRIIDGSRLSVRETAALTHYCTLLLGCSSGISWVSTSDAARQLPMVQMLNPDTPWINPLSRDFERFHLPVDQLIELVHFTSGEVIDCVTEAMLDFSEARKKYNQPVPLKFTTTTGIVYNLLCYLEFKAIRTHIKVNRQVYGNNVRFYAAVVQGFLIFPFRLLRNTLIKRGRPFFAKLK